MTPMDAKPNERARVVRMGIEDRTTDDRIRDTAATDRVLDGGNQRRSRRRKVAIGVVAAIVVIALAYPAMRRWARAEMSVSKERLRFSEVRTAQFVRDISAQGTVVAAVSPTLYAPATGVVTVPVKAGDRVEAGQILASIESPELKTLLDRELAALESAEISLSRQQIEAKQIKLESQQGIDLAEVRLQAADRELRRAEDSHQAQVISEHDYEEAKDTLASAQVQFRHATEDAALESERLDFETRTAALELERQRLAVTDLKRRVDELTVRSPVDGIVGTLAIEDKTAVAPNQAIVTVVDLSALEVEVVVPESYGDDLVQGMAAEVVWGQERLPGVLHGISPEVRNGQLAARVGFAGDPPAGLKRNQRVSVRLVLDDRDDVLLVKRGQFYETGGGRVAYVVNGDFLERRAIETGAASVEAVEIIDGLEPGEEIVISSLETFQRADTVLLSD